MVVTWVGLQKGSACISMHTFIQTVTVSSQPAHCQLTVRSRSSLVLGRYLPVFVRLFIPTYAVSLRSSYCQLSFRHGQFMVRKSIRSYHRPFSAHSRLTVSSQSVHSPLNFSSQSPHCQLTFRARSAHEQGRRFGLLNASVHTGGHADVTGHSIEL